VHDEEKRTHKGTYKESASIVLRAYEVDKKLEKNYIDKKRTIEREY
jgi:hypothetical protein